MWWQVYWFFKYQFIAVNQHSIHSPFLFRFVNEVIYTNKFKAELKQIHKEFKAICKSSKMLTISDFGAGSGVNTSKVRSVGDIAQSVSKARKYRNLLFRIMRFKQPNIAVELGSSVGISGLYLAKGSPQSRLYSLEGCHETAAFAKTLWAKNNLLNIESVVGNFDETLPQLLLTIQEVDLVYIDGNHRYEPTLRYFECFLPKMSEEGILIFDDIYWSEEMTKAWEKIKAHPASKQTVDLYYFGIVFLDKRLAKQDFVVRY
jgi:predicted O-methyltransferase YrrM